MRPSAAPFVVAAPSGARIRTRLRLSAGDEAVLREVGAQLGRLAGQDLAVRCRLGAGDDQRAERKRALTPASSSRWAGAITRTSNDQRQRAFKNLQDERAALCRACRTIRARLAMPVGERRGRVRGYASQAERFQKQRRLQQLEARLAEAEVRLAAGRVSVCRGGRRLAKLRHAFDRDDVARTEAEWRARWEAARLFVTADGEADKRWGNETVRVHPDEGWLELRLPTPLAHLSNTVGRAPTYRLSCPVGFAYRAAEWTAQVASGAVAYTIWLDAERDRWYLDASWRLPARRVPSLEELRQHRSLGVDLNVGHLAGWVLNPAGNPLGPPHTIPLDLDGQPTQHGTAGCGRRSPSCCASPRQAAAGRSRSRTSTSPTPARPGGRPSAAASAASASAALSGGYRPGHSGTSWSAWRPTPACGSLRWIRRGRRCGALATGRLRSISQQEPRSRCRGIMRRRW